MVRSTDRPAMTIAVDLGRKATNKQTNKQTMTSSCNDATSRSIKLYVLTAQSILFGNSGS